MVDVTIPMRKTPWAPELEKLCALVRRKRDNYQRSLFWGTELSPNGLVLRLMARTKPLQHWGMGRYLRQRIKEHFDQAGIQIAYPRMVLLSNSMSGKEDIEF